MWTLLAVYPTTLQGIMSVMKQLIKSLNPYRSSNPWIAAYVSWFCSYAVINFGILIRLLNSPVLLKSLTALYVSAEILRWTVTYEWQHPKKNIFHLLGTSIYEFIHILFSYINNVGNKPKLGLRLGITSMYLHRFNRTIRTKK